MASWRTGAAATFAGLWDAVADSSLWDDHPASLRDVRARIHDPEYAGRQVNALKRWVRYALGYVGLGLSVIAYGLVWPLHREGHLWADHPPAPRWMVERFCGPYDAGSDHALAQAVAVLRVTLGCLGLALMLSVYALAWPWQSESRAITALIIIGVFLSLHAI